MEILREQLDALMRTLDDESSLRASVAELVSVYPFNEFEFIIAHLLTSECLTLDGYLDLRNSYIDRNLYLHLFEISAPRGFGELWAQGHLKELVPGLSRPNKRIDPGYSGQYDFFLDPSIRVEVKASRAVDFESSEPLYLKALSSNSTRPFDMNFQQVKPACCDVFVWIAVWRDVVRIWVIPSYSVQNSRYYSRGQHRGNVGEGQLHINRENIRDFDGYLAAPADLETAIREAYEKQRQYPSGL